MLLSKHELLYITRKVHAIKKATEVAFSEFLLRGISYPSGLYQAAMRKLSSFAFKFFASTTGSPQSYGFCFPELSTLLLFALSKPFHPQQQHTISNMLLVEMGASKPRPRLISRCIFPFGLYSNILI